MSNATTHRTASPTLHRLLDEELAFSPSFLEIYSSHLAMALVALEQMGAGPERLQATFDAHAHSGEAERRADWDALRPRLDEVARDGIAETVRRRGAALADAPGTALFHPAIRLAYALEVGHQGQVAAALLDWETRRTPPAPLPEPGNRRLRAIADDLTARAAGTWTRTFDLDGVGRRPDMLAALAGAAADEQTLDDVSAFALAAHATASDFFTLHLVTGARAVRTVADHLDEPAALALAAHSAVVQAVTYAAVGAPALLTTAELDALRRSALPSREHVAEVACTHRDPHDIKLAGVALAEEERTGDPLYRYLAARELRLVG